MRQVRLDELEWNIMLALRLKVSKTAIKKLASTQAEVNREGERWVAHQIAEQLRKYEILMDAPDFAPPYPTISGNGGGTGISSSCDDADR